MSRHSITQHKLYDYLRDELTSDEQIEVEQHLTSCKLCSKEADELKALLEMFITESQSMCEEHSEEFWNNFPFEVERKIQSTESRKQKYSVSLWERFYSFLIVRNRQVVAFSSALVVFLIAFVVWRFYIPAPDIINVKPPTLESTQLSEMDQKIGQYFRKSKTLLVGISNMNLESDHPIDFSIERKVSRQLVDQARYLQEQPMDINSAKLIGDLERIQIELANLKENNDIPQIEMVRNGIHKENLLFKIRMAESRYDQPRFVNVNNTYIGDRK